MQVTIYPLSNVFAENLESVLKASDEVRHVEQQFVLVFKSASQFRF